MWDVEHQCLLTSGVNMGYTSGSMTLAAMVPNVGGQARLGGYPWFLSRLCTASPLIWMICVWTPTMICDAAPRSLNKRFRLGMQDIINPAHQTVISDPHDACSSAVPTLHRPQWLAGAQQGGPRQMRSDPVLYE